uniref:general transcription factor 3C polypeptide 2-like n=1 Tax=Styela clava TaxID=7725 RepID=UPI0019394484|nr:general transcription factor 3C polypeptide 2-like [Styela clava]
MPRRKGRKNPTPKKVKKSKDKDEQDYEEPMDVDQDSETQENKNIAQEPTKIALRSTNVARSSKNDPSDVTNNLTSGSEHDEKSLSQYEPLDKVMQDFSSLPSDHIELMNLLSHMPPESLYKKDDIEVINPSETQVSEKKYVCPKCGKEYPTKSGIRYHIMQACPNYCNKAFSCLVCLDKFRRRKDVLNHIATVHASASTAYNTRKSRPEFSYAEEISVSTEEDSVPFTPEMESISTPKSSKSSKKTVSGDSKTTFANLDRPLHEVMPWLYNVLKTIQDQFKIVHSELLSNELVSDLNFDFSGMQRSSPFFIKRENKPGFNTECEGLDLFSAVQATKDCLDMTFNVGGPVWAMSWCPETLTNTNSKQYLALATHAGLHSPESVYSEPGMIQIWNCGVLGLHEHQNMTPTIVYGFTTNEAPIWDLKWCPVGGKGNITTADGAVKNRLGILAAACASGKVLILPISEQELLKTEVEHNDMTSGKSNYNSASIIYKANPSMILIPAFGDKFDVENLFGQCLSVDWSLHDGAEWVAGGFSKGLVALWKVKDPSKLLFTEDLNNGPSTLVACRTFHAHIKSVKSVHWCPFASVLATAGLDRALKFWNPEYTEAPIMESKTKGSPYTQICWPRLWCGVFVATDEVFAAPHCHGVAYHCLMSRMPYNTIPFKSACWSVSSSDWMNCVVGGDATGQSVINSCSNWSRKVKISKAFPRIALFSTEVEWQDFSSQENGDADSSQSDNDTSMVIQEVTENSEKSTSKHISKQNGTSSNLSETKDAAGCKGNEIAVRRNVPKNSCTAPYKLKFFDTNMNDVKHTEKRKCHKNVRIHEFFPATNCRHPLVASVNTVSWNPNLGSHTWIASGMECGLVRLHCVDTMHSDAMETAYHNLFS